MSTKTTKPAEANMSASERETEPVSVNMAEGSGSAEQNQEKIPDPCVYCGPSVKGVARQFTVYRGGIPKALEEFMETHKIAKRLLILEAQFAQVRVKLGTPGTVEYMLLQKLKAAL